MMEKLSSNPKVSVIMSVYNAEQTLRAAIDSILKQTYTNWEFIICNDFSTDGTQSILDEYKRLYPDKFILLKNSKNMFLSFSLNRCLEQCTGELVARMDGDDISLPDRFEKQVNFLKNNLQYQVVGTLMPRFDEDGLHDVVCMKEKPDKNILRKQVPFCHATIMMYKEAYDAVGGYKVSDMTRRSQDYDMWFRFYKCGYNGYNIQEPLYLVREDINAIKRRTWNNRYNIMKIQFKGYKLLNFPKIWYIYPIMEFSKAFIPPKVVLMYRKCKWFKKNS